MKSGQERRIAFAIFGIIVSGAAGSLWSTLQATQPFIGYTNAGFVLGMLVALAILLLGEALREQ